MTIDSTVREFVRHERLAWDAHCDGVHADRACAFEGKIIVLCWLALAEKMGSLVVKPDQTSA